MIVYGPEWNDILGQWLSEKNGGQYVPGSMTCLGLLGEDKVIAACGFENYIVNSICGHIALDGKPGKKFLVFLGMCFQYVFHQTKVKKLIAFVDSENEKSVRLNRHMGFVEEGRIKDAGKHGDMIIFTMTEDQCYILQKYLK